MCFNNLENFDLSRLNTILYYRTPQLLATLMTLQEEHPVVEFSKVMSS